MSDNEAKKGSAEVLILALLEERIRHGYEICRLIEERSGGALRFNASAGRSIVRWRSAPCLAVTQDIRGHGWPRQRQSRC